MRPELEAAIAALEPQAGAAPGIIQEKAALSAAISLKRIADFFGAIAAEAETPVTEGTDHG